MADTAIWYWNQKGKAQGPFTFDQLKSFVAKGELRGHELVFKEGSSEWKRASEWNELDPLFDDDKSTFTKLIKLPEEERTLIRTDNKPVEEKWVLLIRIEEDKEIRFKQKGPYGTDEVKRYLREGKVSHADHIWKKGAPKWIPISEVPEFHADKLEVTEEVKELLSNVTEMPKVIEISVPKVEFSKPSIPKVEVKTVEVKAEAPKLEIEREVERPTLIPVIPHVVPAGGSADKSARVESFGRMEAQVVSPEFDEKTDLTEEAEESHSEAVVAPIPLRVEPRAEPRRPQVSQAIEEDNVRVRGWISKLSPALSLLLVILMGVGIWATLKTRSPILNNEKPAPDVAQNPMPEVRLANDPPPKVEVKPAAPVPATPSVSSVVEVESDEDIFDREVAIAEEVEEKTPVKGKKQPEKKSREVAAKESKEVKEPKESKDLELPTLKSEPKSTTLKVDNKAGYLEMIGAFRKGELLEVRVDGNSGSILDLPALHQRLEVRAVKNFVHRISLGDLRVPKGTYQFSVKWGSSRSSKKLTWGGDKSQLEPALVQHRKQIAFDQQQERKKIIRALKDFGSVLTRAEVEAGKGNIKSLQKDVSEKMPAEVKIVRLSRHELIYADSWEKLANQWDRLQTMIKDGGRGPASVSEIAKTKKAVSALESEIKNQSVAEIGN